MISAIVFTSNTGHTAEYARLLGEALDLPAYDLKQAKRQLGARESIVYMGWLMASKVKDLDKALSAYDVQAVCAVGMADDPEQVVKVRENHDLPQEFPVFYLQGGLELDKLSGVYKLMLSAMAKGIAKDLSAKVDRTPQEEDVLDLVTNGGSRVDAAHLQPVVEWCLSNK